MLDSPNGMLGLGEVVPAGSLGVGKRLADDVLKVGIHGGMRTRIEAEGKPPAFSWRPLDL